VDEMNFPLGVIIIVGVLAAIVLGLIVSSPDDVIQPRMISDEKMEIKSEPTIVIEPELEEDLTVCTMQWDPMCGVDGETYGNLCMLDAADIKLDYQGECVVAEPEVMEEVMEPEVMEEVMESESTPVEFDGVISLPDGSGVPGCDETNECFIPFDVSISVGDKITWSNDDSAAHTVTSGTPTDGPDGNFDSSLFMAGNVFSITFNEAGDYPYYCMVHPWMIGIVQVS
jgi:plastocyanin